MLLLCSCGVDFPILVKCQQLLKRYSYNIEAYICYTLILMLNK